MDTVYEGAVVKSVSVENMVNQRNAVLAKIEQGIALINEAWQIAINAHVGFPTFCMSTGYATGVERRITGDYKDREADLRAYTLNNVDAGAWQYLMSESGLRTLMDAKAREKWDEQIVKGKLPEFNASNIRETFGALYDARGDMFDRGVIECFKQLSWCYKTNLPQKFGKKIIFGFLVSKHTSISYCHANHRTCDELDDLMRVFSVIDKKPEPDHRWSTYRLISTAIQDNKDAAENDYISLKWYKKGSGHVTFKRLDLVEQMNQILARHYPNALPAEIR